MSAARQVASVLRSAGFGRGGTVIATESDASFWDELYEEMDEVKRVRLSWSDCTSDGLRILKEFAMRGATLVLHDLPGADVKPSLAEFERDVTDNGGRIVHIELANDEGRALHHAYLHALTFGFEDATRAATAQWEFLAVDGDLCLSSPDGAHLYLGRLVDVLSDFTALERCRAQILQLPLGEIWGVVDDPAIGGTVDVLTPEGIRRRQIQQGRVVGLEALGLLVEVGLGTNDKSMPFFTALGEKASGRVHLGFGDSTLIGGKTKYPTHGDVLLSPGTRVGLCDHRI